MDNLLFPSRKDNQFVDSNTLGTSRTTTQVDGVVHDYFIPTFDNNRVYLQWQEDESFISKRQKSLYVLVGKRAVDILISSAVIVFALSWLFPIIALFILLDSRGPIFFVQADRKSVV